MVVSESTNPPIAKIIDFSKFKYQESKKLKSGQSKTRGSEEKEVRLTPFMAQNDFKNRLDRAREFLKSGYRLKLVVKFVGRQITRREFGVNLLTKAIEDLSDVATPIDKPKWQGKLYLTQLKPIAITKNNQSTKNEQN